MRTEDNKEQISKSGRGRPSPPGYDTLVAALSSTSDSIETNNPGSSSYDWIGVSDYSPLKQLTFKGKFFVFSIFFMIVMYTFPFYSSVFDASTTYVYEWKKFIRLQFDLSHLFPLLFSAATALVPTVITYNAARKRHHKGLKLTSPFIRVLYIPIATLSSFFVLISVLESVLSIF